MDMPSFLAELAPGARLLLDSQMQIRNTSGEVKKILCIAVSSLILAACAAPHINTASAIPWDDRQQIDGLAQQYSWGEDDFIYDGVVTNNYPQ
jgi:hypothetical protein